MSKLTNKQQVGLIVGGILLTLLLAAVFTFGSLGLPFEPKNWRAMMALFAVSTLITAALLVFGLILARTIVRLWVERRREQLGARFKTKMVVGATAISLLPIIFMFFVSYSLINRSLQLWFPRPLELASEETQKLLNDLGQAQIPRLRSLVQQIRADAAKPDPAFYQAAFARGAEAVWMLDSVGNVTRGAVLCDNPQIPRVAPFCTEPEFQVKPLRILASGIEVWQANGQNYFAVRVPVDEVVPARGSVLAGYSTSNDILTRLDSIQSQTRDYYQAKQDLRALKRTMLLILLFFTVLLLSAVLWVALFLAKQVTVPIQSLAEGTREVSVGNFEYLVPEQAQDELGALVRSFNSMTTQLRDSRSQIDQFTRNLQQAVQELERRRQLMETVLENIPTGVVSLDAAGAVMRVNAATVRMFGESAALTNSLEALLGAEGSREVQNLMRRSQRMGVVSQEIEATVAGRMLHLAVTVSALGPGRASTGYVLVLDDLTEMLHAQKSAAWQEVARRIAHEIKNPLTPIQLSAQRLTRFLAKREGDGSVDAPGTELARLVEECARLIEREVSALSTLVNEFSQFVRFPAAKLVATDPNRVVRDALEVFSGRLDGITLKTSFAEQIPPVRADSGLLRSVLVNLIDNAAESLENSNFKEISVATRTLPQAETVEISIADTGRGISPADKDKLFLPHFSTKDRGTGLGLAIAARIVAEHGGSLRVEDNFPAGSRFVIQIPSAELTSSLSNDQNGMSAL
jgi:two-component system nitrogen regulation sensor histidine kinase NtrY